MSPFQDASKNLGVAIYYSALAARGCDGDVIAWESLPPLDKQLYIRLAQDAINQARPTYGMPALVGNVIGAITPDAPYGVARGDCA